MGWKSKSDVKAASLVILAAVWRPETSEGQGSATRFELRSYRSRNIGLRGEYKITVLLRRQLSHCVGRRHPPVKIWNSGTRHFESVGESGLVPLSVVEWCVGKDIKTYGFRKAQVETQIFLPISAATFLAVKTRSAYANDLKLEQSIVPLRRGQEEQWEASISMQCPRTHGLG